MRKNVILIDQLSQKKQGGVHTTAVRNFSVLAIFLYLDHARTGNCLMLSVGVAVSLQKNAGIDCDKRVISLQPGS
jgi:hypothetical protein